MDNFEEEVEAEDEVEDVVDGEAKAEAAVDHSHETTEIAGTTILALRSSAPTMHSKATTTTSKSYRTTQSGKISGQP